MLLYHGTRASFLSHITKHGIKPRTNTKPGNWKHSIPSNPKAVYLTAGYGLYFAMNALPARSKSRKTAVLEVDTDKLDPMLLLPDEDAVEQTARGHDDLPNDWSMLKRTLWYRKNIVNFIATDAWESSVKALGTACYWGTIPPEAITRAAIVDTKIANPSFILAALDPSISVLNWKFCSAKYKNLTKFLFNDSFSKTSDGESDWLHDIPRTGIEVLQFSLLRVLNNGN